MNTMMSSDVSASSAPKKSLVQSAEMFIAVVLFAVCAAAGLAAWLMSLGDSAADESATVETVQVFASLADAELADDEQDVLLAWEQRLEQTFNQREQALRQQEQSAVLEEQAMALAQAQAAAEAAKEAAEAAEQRARQAELARKKALAAQAKPAAPAAPKVAAKPKPKANAERIPASVDWSSCRKPRYPRASIRLKQEGTVTMTFAIDAQGQVVSGEVQQSSGVERLDNAALEAIMKCSFTPETLGGEPQASSAQVRFGWRLGG